MTYVHLFNIEIDLFNTYTIHAYCMISRPKQHNILYQSSNKYNITRLLGAYEIHAYCMENKHTHRLKEGEFRDHRQLHIGTLGRDVNTSELQELDQPGKGRQDVRLHGKYIEDGAKSAEQIGEGPPVQQGHLETHTLTCMRTALLHNHDCLNKWGQTILSGLHHIRGHNKTGHIL
eukprot:1217059-Heterocapsa_arctica.AAC.1